MPDGYRWRGARGEHLLHYMTHELLKNFSEAVEKSEDVSKVDQFEEKMKISRGPLAETSEFFPALWKSPHALSENAQPRRGGV